jgi:hypothetical protein
MIRTPAAKAMLNRLRDIRDFKISGHVEVGENGENLWQLHRGGKTGHIIIDVKIGRDGKTLWIKTKEKNND